MRGGNGTVDVRRPAVARARVEDADERLLASLLNVALALTAAVALLSVLVLAAAHLHDRYNVNHAAGSWLALAREAHDGTIFPLFEHGIYGGTRFMPLPILAHAGLSELTGEYLVSGKLAALLGAAVLLALAYLVLRRLGCSRILSAGFVGVLAVTPAGLLAITGLRGDALSAAIQLGAVALVLRTVSRRAVLAAGVLCGVALFAKLSAVWALIAIAAWLALNHRHRLAEFAAAFGGSVAVLFLAFELASDGRMLRSLESFGFAGGSSGTAFSGVSTFFQLLTSRAEAIWLLFPLALVACALGLARRRPTLLQLAFLVEIPILFVVLRDIGADYNHLIDLAVLTVLVVGELGATMSKRAGDATLVAALIPILVILGTLESLRTEVKPEARQTVKELVGNHPDAYPRYPLAAYVGRGDTMLSEDPTIPLLLGQHPVVDDPFMLQRMQSSHSEWVAQLRTRIQRRAFDKLVLVRPLSDKAWFARSDFGTELADAMRRSYRLQAAVAGSPESYWVYVPRRVA